MTDRRIVAARRGAHHALRAGLAGLRALLVGADTVRPPTNDRRRMTAWLLASAGAAYLVYAAATYLDAKSGLPTWMCGLAGTALAAPLLLVVTRPLLAWRVAWVAAVVTGMAVQTHHRTPFSWHPAILVVLVLILYLVVLRQPAAVSAWAGVSMVVLIWVSFYPADRVALTVMVAIPVAIAYLIRHRRTHAGRARRHLQPS
jgi:hypothetical protein